MEQLVTIIRETLSDDGDLISLRAEKLIQCKDCKHESYCCNLCRKSDDGFCSYAERKGDG